MHRARLLQELPLGNTRLNIDAVVCRLTEEGKACTGTCGELEGLHLFFAFREFGKGFASLLRVGFVRDLAREDSFRCLDDTVPA
jgi:hypothetical protein